MDTQEKVDLIIQFSLLVAGQSDDYRNRQLGPIHFVKYVYLADLFFSMENEGQTFTGILWKFHKFGPWSQQVNERIDPALAIIGAEKQSLPSDFGKDDWHRWFLSDDYLLKKIERALPINITLCLEREILRYGKNTSDLLHFVYSTPPMLNAAPGELLDFSTAVKEKLSDEEYQPAMQRLTVKQMKKFDNHLVDLREKNQARLMRKKEHFKGRVKSLFEPIADEVYEEGMKWLDSLAGEPVPVGEFKAEFDESIWKSALRSPDDLS